MYAALWKLLPGPLPIKVATSAALVLVVLAICFLLLFPWIEPHLPFNQITLEP